MARRTFRRRLVLAAAVAATAAVAAMLYQRAPGGAAGPAPAARPSSTPAAQPSARLPAVPSRPAVSVAGVRMANFHGVMLPVSAADGPRDRHRGLSSGYSDTPLGAVLAAVNIAVRATPQFGPRIFRPTIARQVTGPDTPALLASCASAYDQAARAANVGYGQPLGRVFVAEAGFRLVAWTPAQATVDIASTGPGPQGMTVRAATRVGLEWLAGDWRVVAPPGGDWAAAAAELPSLDGFTRFPHQAGG